MNTDKLFDKIYAHRKQLLIYFGVVAVCTVIRHFLEISFSAIVKGSGSGFLAYTVWSIPFYILIKFLVFRQKQPHVFALMRQIIIYIFAIAALWVANSTLLSILYALTKNVTISLSMTGMLTEIFCMWLMFRVVFKIKK